MCSRNFSVQEVKQMDLVEYLEKLGYSPAKNTGPDYWYISPFRKEQQPSFKVNRLLNSWYDHGLGQGGNLVDFGILYYQCSVKEFLQKITQQHGTVARTVLHANEQKERIDEKKIKIIKVQSITHSSLKGYLKERKIPLGIASSFVEEVHYTLYGRTYFALGFRSDAGGYELRNRFFKGSSSPKDSRLIATAGATELTVVEGFFSFLSYLVCFAERVPLTDFLVLNSLALVSRSMDSMLSYPVVHLLLDNDPAGDAATAKLVQLSASFEDNRSLFSGYKDLNQWLCHRPHTDL